MDRVEINERVYAVLNNLDTMKDEATKEEKLQILNITAQLLSASMVAESLDALADNVKKSDIAPALRSIARVC